MSDSEKLHIKIGLSGTYWDKKPNYTVEVNDIVFFNKDVDTSSDEVFYLEFDVESDAVNNSLAIRLTNKTDSDTIQSEDKTAILKDMLLNIVSIEIDEIDLGHLTYSLSEYTVDATKEVHTNCVNLGWNGKWSLTWTNPFYIWLLESI